MIDRKHSATDYMGPEREENNVQANSDFHDVSAVYIDLAIGNLHS
jgi:hypothetical protein